MFNFFFHALVSELRCLTACRPFYFNDAISIAIKPSFTAMEQDPAIQNLPASPELASNQAMHIFESRSSA